MKVWVVSRASLSENDVYADVWLGVTRAKAIEAVVVGCMLDWWRDYQGAEDEENGVERASYEHIFKEYVRYPMPKGRGLPLAPLFQRVAP